MAAQMCFTSRANCSQRPVRCVRHRRVRLPAVPHVPFSHLFHMSPPPPPPPSHLLVAASLQVFLTCDCVFIPSSAERPPLRPQGLFVPRSSSTNLPPSSPTIQMGSTHHFKRNNKTHFHFKEKGTDCISRCGPHPREPAVISATFFFLSLSLSRRAGKLGHISPSSSV